MSIARDEIRDTELAEPRDYPKLFTLGILHMGQYFPMAFMGSALPFVFRKEGLPLEMFWVLALTAIPNWFKWLIALVVDRYSIQRIGHRKTWIIPCTVIGACCYGMLSFFPPKLDLLYPIVGILFFKTCIMAAQDIAVDAYAAESMQAHERSIGTSIINFLAAIGGMLGLGAVALVDSFGWTTATMAAASLLILAALPAILRKEPAPPELTRQRLARGESPSLLTALRRPDSWRILPLLFVFGFGGHFFGSMVGPFFADKGWTLTQFGLFNAACAFIGGGLGAVVTPWLVDRLGLRNAGLIGVATLPLQGILFGLLAWLPDLPAMPMLIALVATAQFVTSPYGYALSTSRFRWVSKAQAGTDYSMQSSVWNMGIWVAGSTAGVLGASVGWTLFFPVAGLLAALGGCYYVLMFDRIETMVEAREKEDARKYAIAEAG